MQGFFIDFSLAKKPLFIGWFFCLKNILKNIKNFYKKVLTNIKKYVIIVISNEREVTKMNKQERLIKLYENRLEKVKEMYGGDCRKEEYIEFAEKELEEVKNGRQW